MRTDRLSWLYYSSCFHISLSLWNRDALCYGSTKWFFSNFGIDKFAYILPLRVSFSSSYVSHVWVCEMYNLIVSTLEEACVILLFQHLKKACIIFAERQSTRELVWITCIILMMASGRYYSLLSGMQAVNCFILIYSYGVLFHFDWTWLCYDLIFALVSDVKVISLCVSCWQMERLDWAWISLKAHLFTRGTMSYLTCCK